MADKVDSALDDIVGEYYQATMKFGKFASKHEGVAIIEEEFLEFREAAFWPHKCTECKGDDAYTEVKQLAAMCLRYMVDIGRE